MTTQIIPQFPSRDLEQTKAFYERLGFRLAYESAEPDPFLILVRSAIELHFWGYPAHLPETSNFSCYVRFDDVDELEALYQDWQPSELSQTGIPRLTPPEDRAWGMREFYLVDPDGHLLKFGVQVGS